ncbi:MULTISPECIES: phage capsid protein [Acinetobacter]|uniref:phage capsid protein n=1 Tax=Acinetobacter TaxID=469 RepID=UPI0022283CB0|nr:MULTISPECIES: phage capsid protein [Acinetobacter]
MLNTLGEVQAGVERFGATQYSDVSFASRIAVMSDYPNFTRNAIQDFYKLKADPSDRQLTYLRQKWNKHVDKVVYNALLGTAQRKVTGADTYTPVALPSTQVLGDATAPITKQLLIDIKTKFLENEVEEEIYLTYNAAMLNAILADKELTSADYLAGQMLQRR